MRITFSNFWQKSENIGFDLEILLNGIILFGIGFDDIGCGIALFGFGINIDFK